MLSYHIVCSSQGKLDTGLQSLVFQNIPSQYYTGYSHCDFHDTSLLAKLSNTAVRQ